MIEKININEQSSINIAAGKNIYFDPYKIVGEAHDADIIFITHAHGDHFSPADFKKVAKADTVFVAPESMRENMLAAGISEDKFITLRPGDNNTVLDIPVEAVPAYNIGKPMHPKKNGWLGYVITVDNTRIYVSGDTDATPEGMDVDCDIAMVPIGGVFTMNAKQAAKFINEMKPKVVIPTHYGSVVGSIKDAHEFEKLVKPEIQVHIVLLNGHN